MGKTRITIAACALAACCLHPGNAMAQYSAADSVYQHAKGNRLSVGGYGEIALTRNFYSDNIYRYRNPATYKNDPSHGRFDIPHAVIYISYDFGKGWTMSSEIEFEHGGAGGAVEKEWEEGGEWEQETEKGGEVELEQFWIQKSFTPWANVRVGHIVVPVGLTNAHHEPLNYFTVYRPEGEGTILPSTWHDTGISFWGRLGDFRYEVQALAGLDALLFNRDNWIQAGAGSPFEFKVANKYGFAARLDNYTVKGLRVGLSGYYGRAFHNSFPHDMESDGQVNKDVKGDVYIGALDFTLDRWNWVVRGNVDYGYLSDAARISSLKNNSAGGSSPVKRSDVGKNAVAAGIEAGYDIFSQIPKLRNDGQRLYLFGRYEYYDSYIKEASQTEANYTAKNRFAVGVNYCPLPQVVVKAEYSKRWFNKTLSDGTPYNDEPSISIGVAYQGFFL